MRNDFNWPLWHWHFELTSACTLKCPRCSRTEKPETLVIDNLDLNNISIFRRKDNSREVIQIAADLSNKEYDIILKRFDQISYDQVLSQHLKVMDASAISLSRENNIPILVFAISNSGGFKSVLKHDGAFTLVNEAGAR